MSHHTAGTDNATSPDVYAFQDDTMHADEDPVINTNGTTLSKQAVIMVISITNQSISSDHHSLPYTDLGIGHETDARETATITDGD